MALQREIRLGDDSMPLWTWQDPGRHEAVKVDTDGDGTVDAQLPLPSNFLAGVAPVASVVASGASSWTIAQPQPGPTPIPVCPPGTCLFEACHCNPDPGTWDPEDHGEGCARNHWHCKWVCVSQGSGLCAASDSL